MIREKVVPGRTDRYFDTQNNNIVTFSKREIAFIWSRWWQFAVFFVIIIIIVAHLRNYHKLPFTVE